MPGRSWRGPGVGNHPPHATVSSPRHNSCQGPRESRLAASNASAAAAGTCLPTSSPAPAGRFAPGSSNGGSSALSSPRSHPRRLHKGVWPGRTGISRNIGTTVKVRTPFRSKEIAGTRYLQHQETVPSAPCDARAPALAWSGRAWGRRQDSDQPGYTCPLRITELFNDPILLRLIGHALADNRGWKILASGRQGRYR